MSLKGFGKTLLHVIAAGGAVAAVQVVKSCATGDLLAPALVAGLAAAVSAMSESTKK